MASSSPVSAPVYGRVEEDVAVGESGDVVASVPARLAVWVALPVMTVEGATVLEAGATVLDGGGVEETVGVLVVWGVADERLGVDVWWVEVVGGGELPKGSEYWLSAAPWAAAEAGAARAATASSASRARALGIASMLTRRPIEHHQGVTLARVGVVLVALVACAWFGLGIVQTRDTNRASAIVTAPGPLGAAAGAHAASLLHDAGVLNPDTAVKLLRAQLVDREGHPAAARAIVLGVLAGEPRNIDAWVQLARVSQGDPQTFRLALTRARALAPIVPPPS